MKYTNMNRYPIQEAERLVDEIREAGNNSLRRGNNYDAVWKYNHALVLCRDHHLPLPKVAIINSNCAQACLNLKYYPQAYSHADDAIKCDPHSVILEKVSIHLLTCDHEVILDEPKFSILQSFHRRAEASKMLYKEMASRGELFPFLPHHHFVEDAIRDYCHSFWLKGNNCKAVCEAIILAVDNCEQLKQ